MPVQPKQPGRWLLLISTFFLFAVWSNSFIAISFLLGRDGADARFDWIGLTVARFLTAGTICGVYCFGFRRTESMALLRSHGGRLFACGLFAVPAYNLALYYGQQHGVPAPIASLTTTLVPLFVMLLAALTLGEPLTGRRILGFVVAAAGMLVISSAKKGELELDYPALIAITAIAPLSWSFYSVISKPAMKTVSPVLWTYLAITVGSLQILPLLFTNGWGQWVALDATGWAALLYLAIPCTVMGFLVWTWLLRFLPAATVGFTVFLNPPLTTSSKFLLAALAPATFGFAVLPREWAGGLLTLTGMAIAILQPRPRRAQP